VKYLCLIYQDEKKLNALSERELDELIGDCVAWFDDMQKTGQNILAAPLQSVRTATTVRNRSGRTSITDGPFAETKEQLGGFALIEARDLNEAIQLASQMPSARIGCVEVRPLLDPGMPLVEPVDRKLVEAIRRTGRRAPEELEPVAG
jgi:hypothetical protein